MVLKTQSVSNNTKKNVDNSIWRMLLLDIHRIPRRIRNAKTQFQYPSSAVFHSWAFSYLFKLFFIDVYFLWFESQALSLDMQFSFPIIFVLFDRMGTSLKLEKAKKYPVVWWLSGSLCLRISVSFIFLNYSYPVFLFLLNYEVIFLRCYIYLPVNLEICRNILLINSAKFNCGFSSTV